MSENQNRGSIDFAKYDSMETEELEEILRLDAEAPEGQASDGELLLYIMGVLAERKRTSVNPGNTAQEAWESFKENYLPKEEEEHTQEAKQPAKPARTWLPRLIAAAALVAILISIPMAASAFGWQDIWNAVAKWAKETFSFVSDNGAGTDTPEPSDGLTYKSLQQALEEANNRSDIVPTKLPERYILKQVIVNESPMRSTYMAHYKYGEASMKIAVQAYMEADPEKVEINEELLEVYEASGVEYYIFSNLDQLRAVWIVDFYECYISGELTIEEIKMMIDSIGKG